MKAPFAHSSHVFPEIKKRWKIMKKYQCFYASPIPY